LIRLAAFAAVLSVLAACDGRAPAAGGSGAPPPAPASSAAPASGAAPAIEIEHLEAVTGGADARDALPMIVAIHGLGDRPESLLAALRGFDRPARLIAPRGIDRFGDGYSWFPLRGDVSGEEVGRGILRAADALSALLRRLAAERPTRGKPIVTGFSQGGALTLALATHHADRIGAAFPIGGWLPPSIAPSAPAGLPPIVALHGEADTRVPIGPTRDALAALAASGAHAELRAYPGVGHTITAEMRRDLERLMREAMARSGG
jgi:phospholipase/carboxylesterase